MMSFSFVNGLLWFLLAHTRSLARAPGDYVQLYLLTCKYMNTVCERSFLKPVVLLITDIFVIIRY